MELGVVLPQLEIGTDPAILREYAQTAESAGYSHLHAYDHILGVNAALRPEFTGSYDHEDTFHEPFTLFSYFAAFTETIDLVTGVLVLPQRETALVAKQATEVDILTDGRLKLGVGVGWNEREIAALGHDPSTRGRRIEEQIEVLRELWTNELVEFSGEWHDLSEVGLNPLPVQQPIPIWIGGTADVVLRRTARMADGWIVPSKWKYPNDDLSTFDQTMETMTGYLDDAGRDRTDLDVIARMELRSLDPDDWVERVREWAATDVTHLAVSTMGMGLASPREHIEVIQEWKTAVDESSVALE